MSIKMKGKSVCKFVAAVFLLIIPSSTSYTFCVSEENSCDMTGLNCQHCHSLMWYVNNSGNILNDSVFYFLSGNHYLNSSNQTFEAVLNVSNVANLTLQGNKSNVTCKGKQTGLVFYNSSEIVVLNLEFNNCGVNVNSSLQTSLFFELTNHIKLCEIAIKNSKGYGLLMNSTYGFITIDNSVFDRSKLGNAMFQFVTCIKRNLINSTLKINSSNFTNGGQLSSDDSAGFSIYLFQPHYTVKLSNLVIRNNTGNYGGNIAVKFVDFSQNTSQVSIEHSVIDNGVANNSGGGLLFTSRKQQMKDESSCKTDSFNKIIILKVTNTIFTNNIGFSGGGALIAYHERAGTGCTIREVVFKNCDFTKNRAVQGAVMYVKKHERPLYLHHYSPQFEVHLKNINIYYNSIRKRPEQKNQDGIVQVLSVKDLFISNTNFINNKGTALFLLNSAVRLHDRVVFEKNRATFGGAIKICDDSRMYFNNDTRVQFLNNNASKVGGAIYIGNQCLEETPPCFFQFLSDKDNVNISSLATDILSFDGNNASYAGHALYGGQVENCFTDIELIKNGSKSYYYSMQLFNQTFEFPNRSKPSLITSDPYGTCACKENTTDSEAQCDNRAIYIDAMYPGQYRSVYVSAVGQLNGTVPAYLTVYNSSSKHFFVYQKSFEANEKYKTCKRIFLTIQLKENKIPKNQIRVKIGIKNINFLAESSNYYKKPKLEIRITLLPCPFLFVLNKTCTCPHPAVLKHYEVTCDLATETFKRPKNVWIGYSIDKNTNKYTITAISSKCEDRCKKENLTFGQSNFSDICKTGRIGRLCGACDPNYSLTLGQLECIESDTGCSASATVLLLLIFILAGILIFFFVAFFNLTVAEGTINGLMFYANFAQFNLESSMFKSSGSTVGKLFISWLNLDFGFEVCFYAGMTAYQKIWLEFGFLLYLLFLGLVIVCLSRRFVWFTRLAGRNVVPVLATISMLAYPKLIILWMASVGCSQHYRFVHIFSPKPGIKNPWMWKLDETLDCFSGVHIVLVTFTSIMLSVCLVYVLCLLLIQCLLKGSGCCLLRWVDKSRPFFDAHTGPCNDHYRFWPGFLLFLRLGIYLLFKIVDDNFKGEVMTVACVLTIFLAFVYPKGVYKKWTLNVLEFLFLLNLTIFSILSTLNKFYQRNYESDLSIGFTFLLLLLIISYNCYKKISKTKQWMKIMSKIKKRNRNIHQNSSIDENVPLTIPIEGQSPLVDFSAPREELLYDD